MGTREPEPRRPLVVRGVQTGDDDGDVLDHGYDRRPRRGLAIVAAVLAAVAVLAGYLHARGEQQQASPTRSNTPLSKPPLAGAGDTCAAQVGARLVLGARVVNQSSGPVVLEQAQAVLPLDGMRYGRPWWTDCEHVAAEASQELDSGALPAQIPAGQTSWVTMVFEVLVECPAPLPVGFVITYSQDGQSRETTVRSFPDLGGLPYSPPLCTASPS